MTIDECVFFSVHHGASTPAFEDTLSTCTSPFWALRRETHPSLADEGDQNLDAAGEHADAFCQSSAGWTGSRIIPRIRSNQWM